jgi:FkbM family methyltransferase
MSYAQFGTDEFLSSLFDNDYVGVGIDVGSAQPIYGNNTYFFEQKGWTIHCIEPNPKLLERLIPLRKNVHNFAVGNENKKEIDFHICTLRDGNQEAISSLKIDERLVESHNQYSPKFETIKVELKSLTTFLEENNIDKIDFVSIDTEGTELDVLKGFDLKKYTPKVLVIENNFDEELIRIYLKSYGYEYIKRLGVNDFFQIKNEINKRPVIEYSTTGNIGDVIHELYVIKKMHEKTGIKGKLLLKNRENDTDGFFYRPVEDITSELNELLKSEQYFDSCEIYSEYSTNIVNLDEWRTSQFIYKLCWIEILSTQYNMELNKNGENIERWISFSKNESEKFKDKVIIHQSIYDYRKIESFPWIDILTKNDCIFVSFEETQYLNFKFKEYVNLHIMKDFSEFRDILSNCKFYVGNLTSLTAFAHAMRIPRLIEFTSINTGDFRHYLGEKKYSENMFYISEQQEYTDIDGLETYINL